MFGADLYERHGETSPTETVSISSQWSSTRQHHSNLPAQEISDPPEESLVEERSVEAPVLPLHLVSHEVMEQLLSGPACNKVMMEDFTTGSAQVFLNREIREDFRTLCLPLCFLSN